MKHIRHIFLTGLLSFISLISSCDRQKTKDSSSKIQPQSVQLEPLSLRTVKSDFGLIFEFVEHGLNLPGQTRARILASLGKPDSVITKAWENRYTPEVADSVIIMFYKDLEVGIYNVGFDRREFIISALVKNNRYLKYADLIIGTDIATLKYFG